ncbi:hypothetical protein ACWEP4_42210 [Streptomyces sp. NPDC004227]
MAGKRKAHEAGSTNDLRGDVLRVLGVLKVATADQLIEQTGGRERVLRNWTAQGETVA